MTHTPDPHLELTSGAPDESRLAREKSWRGTGTILVAEDEESVRVLTRHTLERIGFRVLTAVDGVEAVSLFEAAEGSGDAILCVILDMTMPRMDGGEALRRLRERRADVRVIMTSGYDENELRARHGDMRLAGFLQKPYRNAALRSKLLELLGSG